MLIFLIGRNNFLIQLLFMCNRKKKFVKYSWLYYFMKIKVKKYVYVYGKSFQLLSKFAN